MSVDLLCMGEPMLEFSQLPPPADGKRLYLEGFGGDTSNTAIAAARQGARVGYITAVGKDAGGDAFLQLWQSEGVDTATVIRRPDLPTAVYFVMRREADHEFLFYRAGSAAASYRPADLPEEAIARARIFYASGISQAVSTSAADAVFRAIEVARTANAAVAYDTNYRRSLWPVARARAVIHGATSQARYVFASQEDAEALTGFAEPDAILDFYLRLGPEVVVLKQGGEGALMATAHQRLRIRPPKVRAVDSTGAGDVLSGAFLARVLAGDTVEAAARYAVTAASLSTLGYGAVAPIPREAVVREAMEREGLRD
jgi:2-dehydro-3-deoxygluconokinase